MLSPSSLRYTLFRFILSVDVLHSIISFCGSKRPRGLCQRANGFCLCYLKMESIISNTTSIQQNNSIKLYNYSIFKYYYYWYFGTSGYFNISREHMRPKVENKYQNTACNATTTPAPYNLLLKLLFKLLMLYFQGWPLTSYHYAPTTPFRIIIGVVCIFHQIPIYIIIIKIINNIML